MKKLAGIILAAGLSSRMGAFKPLLEIGGKSMARRVVELVQKAGADPVIVVTGHRHEELEAHLAGWGVRFVHNPGYASTQQLDSLKLALAALSRDCGRVLVTPADIPLVRSDTVERLLAAEGDFIRPRFEERTGHPVVLSVQLIPELLCYDGPGGLKGAIQQSGCVVRDVVVDDPGVLMDNDTPEEFRQTLARFGGTVMRKLFEHLNGVLNNGKDAVLVTVVTSSGSTPRGAGARMLVTDEGRVSGTIGGGAVEYRAQQMAGEVLAAKSSRMESFILRKNEVQDLGMVCGGDVTVYFHYLSAQDSDLLAVVQAAGELFQAGETSWLATGLFPGGGLSLYGTKRGLIGPDVPAAVLEQTGPTPRQVEAEGRTYYIEPLLRGGVVYIFGGGHVAQALVPALTAVDFRCQVIEDREEFCRPELFPGVERTHLLPVGDFENELSIGPEDYVCIMTRGHKDDMACEAFALRTPARYIGVIGSRKKTAAVNAQLREQGFTDDDLSRVTTPIGLSIGAQTPAEIAVSVAAQLIQVRRDQKS